MWLAEALSILWHFVALLQTLVNKSAPTSHSPLPEASALVCAVCSVEHICTPTALTKAGLTIAPSVLTV